MSVLFVAAKDLFPRYFKLRLWSARTAINFSVGTELRKNVEKHIYSLVMQDLRNNYKELIEEFKQRSMPVDLLAAIKDALLEAEDRGKDDKSKGVAKVITEMIDYMPTCVVLAWVINRKLKELQEGKKQKIRRVKEYLRVYEEYSAFLKSVIDTWLKDYIPVESSPIISSEAKQQDK